MDKYLYDLIEESPALPGPDYVAVLIDWDADTEENMPAPAAPPHTLRKVAIVAGALSAVALAAWGVHRLRAA